MNVGGTFKEVAGNPHIQVFEPRIDGFFCTALAIVFGGALLFLVGGTVQLAAGIHGLTRAGGSRQTHAHDRPAVQRLRLAAVRGFGFARGHTEYVESLALWALAKLLPVYSGEDNNNLARSLRRRFAVVGLLFSFALIGSVWEWTANIAVTVGASVVIVAGLWLYSEHGDRPAA